MYPLTHLYFTKNVLGRLSSALALGSVLPDILTSVGMKWKEAHSQNIFPHKEMLLGNLIHGINLPGLDYYSDCAFEGQEGFAFQYAKHLEMDLTELGIPKEHSIWRGHNFIEMAIEVRLNQTEESELWKNLELASQDENLKAIIYDFLSEHNYNEIHLVDLALERFLTLRGNLDKLAIDYAKKLSAIYQLHIDPKNCQDLILKAQTLINGHYKSFLEKCCDQIKQDIAHFI